MKKRFFNALLLGAVLLSTNAVTSCKDYDDDINNLQSQIDKMAKADELKSAVEQLNSAVSAAKTDAANALDAAKAAQSTADKKADATTVADLDKAVKEAKAAAEKAAADLATAQKELTELINSKASADDLAKANKRIDDAEKAIEDAKKVAADADAALKKEMTQAVADATKDLVTKAALDAEVKALDAKVNSLTEAAIGKEMEKLQKELEALQGIADKLKIAYSSMITDIQLFHNNGRDEYFDNRLSFMFADEVNNDWSWNMPKEIDGKKVIADAWSAFKDDEKWKFHEGKTYVGEDSVLVRVSPANAGLKKENISLINSRGEEIGDVIEISDVHKFDRLLTQTRANASETGLWVVKFKPVVKEGVFDSDAFENAAVVKQNSKKSSVLYAVAVKDSVDNVSADRRVTSDYALSLFTQNSEDAYDFDVNETPVSNIRNRYYATENGTSTRDIAELIWTGKKKASVAVDGDGKNAADRYNNIDNRNGKMVLAVERGQDIVIDFSRYANVKGFYVTLDDKFALESGNSEVNAWCSYKYKNVGYTTFRGDVIAPQIFESSKGSISIEDLGSIVGDIIGFRVYAVNYDGTLTDPDGRAFYVAVGEIAGDVSMKEAATAHINFVDGRWILESGKITTIGDKEVSEIFANSEFNNITGWKNETEDASGAKPVFNVKYYDAEDNEVNVYSKKIAYLKFQFDNPTSFVDNAKYTQSLTLRNNVSAVTFDVCKITVSFEKTMPEIVPTYARIVGQEEKQWLMPTGNSNDYLVEDADKNGSLVFDNFLTSTDDIYRQWGFQSLYDFNEKLGYYDFEVADGTYRWNNNGYELAALPVLHSGYYMSVLNKPASNVKNLILGFGQADVKHAVSATYSYFNISKDKDENGNWKTGNYKVSKKSANQQDVNIIYCSWTKDLTLKYSKDDAWQKNQKNVVKWVENYQDYVELDLNNVAIAIAGNIIPSLKPASQSLGALITDGYLKVVPSTVSGGQFDVYTKSGSQVNPYFLAEFGSGNMVKLMQHNQNTMTPTEHAEDLCFRVKDCFGCEFDIVLPIKVKP